MTGGSSAAFATPSARGSETPVGFGWRFVPVWVALGSLLLGVARAGSRSLSSAEATSLAQASGSFAGVFSHIVHHDPGETGGLLLLRLGVALGDTEMLLRLPFAVTVAVAAGLTVVLGNLLFGRLAGLVAGIAFAGNAAVVLASREARPYASGLLWIVASTLLFVWALERGGTARWIGYALVAVLLPLAHPLAASILLAHGAALAAVRDQEVLRRAGVALFVTALACGALLAWMAADRRDAAHGASLHPGDVVQALWHAVGRNPVLLLAAAVGLVALFGTIRLAAGLWPGALAVGLVLAPLLGTLAAATVLPVFTGALVLIAPGLALTAGAAAVLLPRDAGLLWAALALLGVSCAATIALRLHEAPAENWRALARAVERVRGERETVVVVPESSRDAFVHYAPNVHVIRFARGEGAWIAVVAATPAEAIERARPFVATPRYALLRQFRYGGELRLQHWVRP